MPFSPQAFSSTTHFPFAPPHILGEAKSHERNFFAARECFRALAEREGAASLAVYEAHLEVNSGGRLDLRLSRALCDSAAVPTELARLERRTVAD